MKNHTHARLPNINEFVSPEFCKKASYKTGFIKRSTSRLNGYEFVKAMILGGAKDTLLHYKKRIKQFNPKVDLSLPGLAQRINRQSAEDLMFLILSKCLTSLYEKVDSKIKNISRILIQDSTCIPLNKQLAAEYAGSGGHYKNAGIKIDCIYDYFNEAILDVNHHPRVASDIKNGEAIFKHLEPGDLVLRDLGYFKISDFKKIEEKNAFYVSRMKLEVVVYLCFEDKRPVPFIEFLKKKLRKKTFLDTTVFIGHAKQKVRLIVNKLPNEIINQKLRKAHRDAQIRRTTLSDAKKAFLSYTMLITNLPLEMASASDILLLYRIRWRIELVFKEWKSQICIGNLTGTNIHRIRCLIYARLCLLLIINKLTSYTSHEFFCLYSREICLKRVLDLVLEEANKLKLFNSRSVSKMLNKILISDPRDYFKDKRKNRKTTLERIQDSVLAA